MEVTDFEAFSKAVEERECYISSVEAAAKPKRTKVKPMNAGVFRNSIVKIPEQVVHGVISKGSRALLVASSKARKTRILLILAYAVASGAKWLVYRLANNGDVAGGQLAVFQGASEAPISASYVPAVSLT